MMQEGRGTRVRILATAPSVDTWWQKVCSRSAGLPNGDGT